MNLIDWVLLGSVLVMLVLSLKKIFGTKKASCGSCCQSTSIFEKYQNDYRQG